MDNEETQQLLKDIKEEKKDLKDIKDQPPVDKSEKLDWELEYKKVKEDYEKLRNEVQGKERDNLRKDLIVKYEIPEENRELVYRLLNEDEDDEKQIKELKEKYPQLFGKNFSTDGSLPDKDYNSDTKEDSQPRSGNIR